MMKIITYVIHVLQDTKGDVIATQCNCAVGTGPKAHCKHIQALFLALIESIENKVPLIELSSTNVIQTFHHPKRSYRGFPVKARDLRRNVL